MGRFRQRAMHCRCGKAKLLAHGMCAVCYTLRRQDEEYFGGLREKVWSETATDAACVTPLAAINGPSSFTTVFRQVAVAPDDLPVSCLSCEDSPYESGHAADATASVASLARSTPKGSRTNGSELQPAARTWEAGHFVFSACNYGNL